MADGPKHRRELGMLVVVVLKAQHLSDPHHFSKQDPLVELEYDSRKERTQVDRGGGQTPLWDEEFRFRIFEVEGEQQYLHVRVMREERKDEVELIGEAKILVDGSWREFDEWVQVKEGGKYRGEVYLEATFYPAIQQPITNLQRRPSKLDPSSRLSRVPANLPASLQPGVPSLAHRLSVTSLQEEEEAAHPALQTDATSQPSRTSAGLLPFPGDPDTPELPPALRPSQAPTISSTPVPIGIAGTTRLPAQQALPARLPTPGSQEYLPYPRSTSPYAAATANHYSPSPQYVPDTHITPPAIDTSPSPALYAATPHFYAPYSPAPPAAHSSAACPTSTASARYASSMPAYPHSTVEQYQPFPSPSPHLVVSAPPPSHAVITAELPPPSPPPVPPRPPSASPSPSQTSPTPVAAKPRRSAPPPPPSRSPPAQLNSTVSTTTSPSPPPRPSTSRPLPPNPAGDSRPSLSPSLDAKMREASSSTEEYRAPPPAYSPSGSGPSVSPAETASRQTSLEAQRRAEAQRAEEAERARQAAERSRQQREEEEQRRQREKEERAVQIERERIKRVEEAQRALAARLKQEQEDARMAAQLAAEAEEAERRKEEERRAADEEAVRRLMEEERAEEERRRRAREAEDEAFIRELREEEARREAEERRAREEADAAMAQRLREEEEQERQRRLVEDERIARSLAEQDGARR